MDNNNVYAKLTTAECAALQYRCPITERRLSEAVVIIPCCCKVNHEVVKKIKVKVENEIFKPLEPATCPVPKCSKMMVGYCEDHVTRKNVQVFFERLLGNREVLLNIPNEKLKKAEGTVAYPGERGNFYVKLFDRNRNIIIFASKNKSILKTIFFSCKADVQNPSHHICIKFLPSTTMIDFLIKEDFYLSDRQIKNHYLQVSKLSDMRRLLSLMAEYNDFPAQELEQVYQQIEKFHEENLNLNFK